MATDIAVDLVPNFDGRVDPDYPDGDRSPTVGDWQLPIGNRVGQKLPLSLVHPQPDVDTFAYASHRKASTNHTYRTRVTIQGGEMPFKMELVTAPAGATIVGEFTRANDPIVAGMILHSRPDDYGEVSWPNATGTGTFEVLVTDQSGATVTVEWTAETDDTAFVYLDAVDGSDAADGSFATPLKTFNVGLWKSSDVDSTYANKIVCYKTGTYQINAASSGDYAAIDAGIKPRGHIAIESGVIFDMSTGHFYCNTDNIAFYDVVFDACYALADNCRIIEISSKGENFFFDTLTFQNHTTAGTNPTDNPACIETRDASSFANNISVINVINETTTLFQQTCFFSSKNILIEGCSAVDINHQTPNAPRWQHIKDDCWDVSIRFCHGTATDATELISMSNQQSVGLLAANQEVCYNYVEGSGYIVEGATIGWNQAAVQVGIGNAANTHEYRNTVKSNIDAIRCESFITGGDDVILTADIYIGTNYVYSQSADGYDEVAPLAEGLLTADVDSAGALTDTNGARTAWLGTRGHEVAS
jgi:hypothetical protein